MRRWFKSRVFKTDKRGLAPSTTRGLNRLVAWRRCACSLVVGAFKSRIFHTGLCAAVALWVAVTCFSTATLLNTSTAYAQGDGAAEIGDADEVAAADPSAGSQNIVGESLLE